MWFLVPHVFRVQVQVRNSSALVNHPCVVAAAPEASTCGVQFAASSPDEATSMSFGVGRCGLRLEEWAPCWVNEWIP